MRSFFLTIILISTAATVIILYYLIKQYVNNKKYRQKISLIRKKLYEDDRVFMQSRMRRLIPDLKSGHLRWMIVSSKTVKERKLEITYSSINDDIEIKDRARNRNKSEIKLLNNLGAESYHTLNEINVTSAPRNPKIITDIIYFIFEDIFNNKPAQNLKILTSGE